MGKRESSSENLLLLPFCLQSRLCTRVDAQDIQSRASGSSPGTVKKTIVLESADGYALKVEEAVALQMCIVEYNRNNIENEPFYRLPGITKETLVKVIDYCSHHVEPYTQTKIKSFDAEFVKQLDPVVLFNLIQAAHHFKIKSLMDLTCQTLVKLVKTKTFGEIMKEFKIGQEYVQILFGKHIESLPKGLQIAIKDFEESVKLDRLWLWRQHEKELFIRESDFVDSKLSPFLTTKLSFVNRRNELFGNMIRQLLVSTDLKKLSEVTELLQELIVEEPELSGGLGSDAVQRLLQILNEYDMNEIQCEVVYILSRANFDNCKDVMTDDAIPALVKHVSGDAFYELGIASVVALTCLAKDYPGCIEVILKNGALDITLRIIKGDCAAYTIICYLAKFVAVVCRNGITHDKAEVALNILEELLQKELEGCHHLELACYALQYLTYGHNVAIGKKSLGTLMDFIRKFYDSENPVVASSALGVVGNLVRWVHTDDQIQCLVLDYKLLGCLRRIMVCCKFKKLWMEACQIVSNIAARSNRLIKDMDDEVDFIESLCGLLEKDESDVKMEAAWAMFNCVYGNISRQIDNYSKAWV